MTLGRKIACVGFLYGPSRVPLCMERSHRKKPNTPSRQPNRRVEGSTIWRIIAMALNLKVARWGKAARQSVRTTVLSFRALSRSPSPSRPFGPTSAPRQWHVKMAETGTAQAPSAKNRTGAVIKRQSGLGLPGRAPPAASSCFVCGVLQSNARALGIIEKCALASSSPTVRCHYRHSDLGRIAPSIRPDMIFGKDS